MLIFRKEHNEWHLHTVRGNIFKKNQRRGVFYGGNIDHILSSAYCVYEMKIMDKT